MSADRHVPRTYSLLEPRLSQPSEYEIVTSRLHYYAKRGFELELPLSAWYRTHQAGSALRCDDWEAFQDPRQTTYTTYTRMQTQSEQAIAKLAAQHEAEDRDALRDPEARAALRAWIGPSRFVVHGMHMAAAYVGHMAPSGRIALCALFQAADELRRVEHLAYRLCGLLARDAGAQDGRDVWQRDPAWQPARELIERLLVTYDFGEAFAALALCVKPLLDGTLHAALRADAERAHDAWLAAAVDAFEADAAWHRAWATALAEHAIARDRGAREALQGYVDRWWPRALRAAAALRPEASAGAGEAALREHAARLTALGLRVSSGGAPS